MINADTFIMRYSANSYLRSILFVFIFLSSVFSFAVNNRTTYQAKIIKPDGLPLEAVNVNFKFTILDPSASCVLYSEEYSAVNMQGSGGLTFFSLGAGNRTYPVSGGTTLESVLDNSVVSFACQTPGLYAPTSVDNRKVVMQFNDGNGWQTLPAMAINSVPYAMYAGKSDNAIKFNGKSDTAFVEYSTLTSLNCNSTTHAITFNGISFSCIPVTSSSVTSASVIAALGYTPENSSVVATSFTAITNSMNSVGTSVTTLSSTVNILSSSYTNLASAVSGITSSQWTTNGSDIGYITGNVGIGTTTPGDRLHVLGTTMSTNYKVDSTGSVANPAFQVSGSNAGIFFPLTTGYEIGFKAGAAERMRIDANGNVGIGTTTPSFKLELSGVATTADRKFGINGKQVMYLPDQTNFTGSLFFGDGGQSVSHTTGSTGLNNTSVGLGALYSNTTGWSNSAIGADALYSNTTGRYNVATGHQALASNTTGSQNVATGYQGLYSNTTGTNNTANGYQALRANTIGSANISTGYQTLYANIDGNFNVATGFQALYNNTSGSNNFAAGMQALFLNSSGSNNIANGYSALYSNSTGNVNIATGYMALYSNTTGIANIATGYNSLRLNTTGGYNIAMGYNALYSNRSKSESTALGYNSMYYADSVLAAPVASYNTAIGAYSLYGSTTAANNTGTMNTAFGHSSLRNMTSGSGNIGVGYNAGSAITTGNFNVVIGSNTGSSIATVSNTVLIADGQGNERMRITSAGEVGIGTTTPVTKLEVSGGVRISMESATCATSYAGTLRYNVGSVEFCNGISWAAFGTAGSGVGTFNGSTSSTQTLSYGSTGTAPTFNTTNGVHTLNIPLASAGSVTAGLISNADYTMFVGKITSSAASIAQVLGYVPAASGAAVTQWTTNGSNIGYTTGKVGIGTTTPSFKLELSGTATTADRKIGINNKQVVYLPDQTNFNGSLFIGDGGASIIYTAGNDGMYNTSVGIGALLSNTTGNGNVANGFNALRANTTGYSNTANGYQALYSNTTGQTNAATGYNALYYNSSGGGNVANGFQSLFSNTTGNYNIATGAYALQSNTTGGENTATGYQALLANTTSFYNVAYGNYALRNNITGSSNVANGSSALYSNLTKSESTAIGYNSMYYADSVSASPVASYNTALGAFSLQGSTTSANNTGTMNTALGHSSLKNMTSGSGNIGVGYNAGSAITTGSSNVVIGSTSASAIATTSNNVLIADGQGNERVRINSSGNVGIGTTNPLNRLHVYSTTLADGLSVDGTNSPSIILRSNGTIKGYAPAISSGVGSFFTDSVAGDFAFRSEANNILFGRGSGASTMAVVGSNVGIGTTTPNAKLSVKESSTAEAIGLDLANINGSGSDQTSVAINLHHFGDTNPAVKIVAQESGTATYLGNLQFHTRGTNSDISPTERMRVTSTGNVGIGTSAPAYRLDVAGDANVTGDLKVNALTVGRGGGSISGNTALGENALLLNTFGEGNVANGSDALRSNTTGDYNTANGRSALRMNTTGYLNVATGFQALYSNTTGRQNTANGVSALQSNTTGMGNIGVGYDAGSAITTGNYNVVIGSNTGSSIATVSNTVLIADGQGNERIRVDSAGNVGIGTTAPSYNLDVSGTLRVTGTAYTNGGYTTWTAASDQRLKDIHGSYDRGLADILGIDIVRFQYKANNTMGLDSSKEFVGVTAQNLQTAIPEAVNEETSGHLKGYLTINTTPVLWTLVNAVKELYHKFVGVDREVASIKAENVQLKLENAAQAKELDDVKARLEKIEKALNAK